LRDRQYLQIPGGVSAINFLEEFAITWALSEGVTVSIDTWNRSARKPEAGGPSLG